MGRKQKNRQSIFHLSDLSIVKGLREFNFPERENSIYFLLAGEQVVYVGKSFDLLGRLATHRHNMSFDRVVYFPIDKSDRLRVNTIEAAFIKALKPPYNCSATVAPMHEGHKGMLAKYCSGGELKPTFGFENREATNG